MRHIHPFSGYMPHFTFYIIFDPLRPVYGRKATSAMHQIIHSFIYLPLLIEAGTLEVDPSLSVYLINSYFYLISDVHYIFYLLNAVLCHL